MYTASVGVPSTDQRSISPSGPRGGKFSIRRGRCSGMLRLVALCSRSGAQTTTSPSSSSASARARSPGASAPSSLDTRIRMARNVAHRAAPCNGRLPERWTGTTLRGMSEARTLASQLPRAPERLAAQDGTPRFGLYAGSPREARFATLAGAPGPLERRLIEKKWQYAVLSTPEMMLAIAVIDVGYLSSGICAVFDRGSRRLLVDDNPVLPPICSQVAEEPADGMSARLFGPRIRARLQRVAGRVSIQARWAHADVDLLLDATRAPPPITAIAPVGPPGRFDFTHKTVLLPAEGEVRAGNVRLDRKSTRLNSSHGYISYAVFCLKKKRIMYPWKSFTFQAPLISR